VPAADHTDRPDHLDDVDDGIARLRAILPLGDRRARLDPESVAVHREILLGYLAEGHAPSRARLEASLPTVDVPRATERLAAADLVVTAGDHVIGAYPFRTGDTPHVVTVDGVEAGAMCSLDALAIGAVTGGSATIRSTCAETGRTIVVRMAGGAVVAADPPAPVVGIRWQDPGSCAAATLCREMVFLEDAAASRRWAGSVGTAGRYGLTEAVEFADRFFRPVMAEAVSARAVSRTGGSTAG
jgi:hypothetical protein